MILVAPPQLDRPLSRPIREPAAPELNALLQRLGVVERTGDRSVVSPAVHRSVTLIVSVSRLHHSQLVNRLLRWRLVPGVVSARSLRFEAC